MLGIGSSLFTVALFVVALIVIVRAIRVVPQQHAWIVERVGRFYAVLEPGLNFVIPFVDRIAFRHDLREIPLDVPSQICITKDNTQLQVDGILYFQVTDPKLASYGSSNYIIAITQLAQTTLRSIIGRGQPADRWGTAPPPTQPAAGSRLRMSKLRLSRTTDAVHGHRTHQRYRHEPRGLDPPHARTSGVSLTTTARRCG